MKITVDSGERVLVIVPSHYPSRARVSIETEGGKVADVIVEDGLISNVYEHVSRRRELVRDEDRLALWAHLISEHAVCLGLDLPLAALIKIHDHEHAGPGTIRNHDSKSRDARIAKIIHVLGEAESGIADMENSELQLHAKRVNDEIQQRLANNGSNDSQEKLPENDDDPYEGSWREAADNEGARIAAEAREDAED
jgi:hypothetical protein